MIPLFIPVIRWKNITGMGFKLNGLDAVQWIETNCNLV